jgi:hypothetical protein
MKILRNGTAAIALAAASFFAAPAHAGGVPGIDGTSLAQIVAQLEQMRQQYATQLEELATMQQELATAQEQLTSITGSRGISSVLNSAGDIQSRVAAFSLDSIQQSALSGSPLSGLDGMNSTIDDLRSKFALGDLQAIFDSSEPIDQAIAEQASAGVAAIATAEDTYTRSNDAMGRINTMINQIDTNADLKASIDYNTRVMAELAVLLNENLRIQAANANVAGANALSEARDAAKAREFRRVSQ